MKLVRIFCYFTGVAMALSLTACSNSHKAADQNKTSSEPAVAAKATIQPPATPGAFKGKVLETKDVGGYTYVRLDDGSKDGLWAAVPKAELKVGEEITLKGGAVMTNFTSKTLNKTFDKIIFAGGVLRGDQAAAGDFASAAASGTGATGMTSGGSAGSIVPFADLKIAKAQGSDAYTVGELFDKRKELNNKAITVRGKVVKISRNIMGKNWIHIQDGTGDPTKNTHDLVVTTSDNTAVKGDTVTVKGTVEADKDFGAGYKYDVIIEKASVSKDASPVADKAAKAVTTVKKAAQEVIKKEAAK